jgi:small-conductance mechanosensitive channel
VDQLWDLIIDTDSIAGRAVTSAAIVLLAVGVAVVAGRLLGRRSQEPYTRYYTRKGARYVVALLAVIALAVVWRAFAGRLGVVLGLAAAGVAFAMQEVIGAIAGWFNILSGRIFRVGDRIQMGGVRGDVIDITPLRTKIMEIGSANDDGSWVRGRQYTGRIVAVSNKATFTEPAYNFSAVFDFVWEELTLPIPYDADWQRAEDILREEVRRTSTAEGAHTSIEAMTRRYPIERADVEPNVYLRATDNWAELSARFVVPVRTARRAKDALTRRVLDRLYQEGIPIASETSEVTVHHASRDTSS